MTRVVLVIAALAGLAGTAQAQLFPPPIIIPTSPPKGIPSLPKSLPGVKTTTCKMKGPAWVLYGAHAPNGQTRRGNRYKVHARGMTCKRAKRYLRAFFPKIPPHPMGTLKGGPKGFKCKGGDPPGTKTKSTPHDGSCRRTKPAATFDWAPTGGKVG
jgi:hypothetical protein